MPAIKQYANNRWRRPRRNRDPDVNRVSSILWSSENVTFTLLIKIFVVIVVVTIAIGSWYNRKETTSLELERIRTSEWHGWIDEVKHRFAFSVCIILLLVVSIGSLEDPDAPNHAGGGQRPHIDHGVESALAHLFMLDHGIKSIAGRFHAGLPANVIFTMIFQGHAVDERFGNGLN